MGMPASEFETALSERIEFAAFVAYEQWVRAVRYTSDNPYDVLARLLPGLNEALEGAIAAHGGWNALEPVSGLPAETGRQLIAAMAAQVVSAQIAAVAPHAPGAALLTQVISDAVSRAVTVFVDDPESWRLAMRPGEGAPMAAMAVAPEDGGPGEGITDSGTFLPAAPLPPDEGGAYGERMVHAVESAPRAKGGLFGISELWFVKAAAAALGVDVDATGLAGVMVHLGFDVQRVQALAGDVAGGSDRIGELIGRDGGIGPAIPGLAGRPPAAGGGQGWELKADYLARLEHLPDQVAAEIQVWAGLLTKASFYHVGDDGAIVRLSASESAAVVDTLLGVLIGRAELSLSLPSLPAGHQPAPASATHAVPDGAGELPAALPAAPADPPLHTSEAGQHGGSNAPALVSGLGSGSLDFGPMTASADGAAELPPVDATPIAALPAAQGEGDGEATAAVAALQLADASANGHVDTQPIPLHPHPDYIHL